MIEVALFVIAAVAGIYLVRPALRRQPIPARDPRASAQAARAALLRALHDLDLDWATGKLSDQDYQAQRAALESDAAALTNAAALSQTPAGPGPQP